MRDKAMFDKRNIQATCSSIRMSTVKYSQSRPGHINHFLAGTHTLSELRGTNFIFLLTPGVRQRNASNMYAGSTVFSFNETPLVTCVNQEAPVPTN